MSARLMAVLPGRDPWRLTPSWRERLQGFGLGSALGLLLVAALWREPLQGIWDMRQTLAKPPTLDAGAGEAQRPHPMPPAPGLTGPGLAEGDAAWLWLRERLQAQGLQVQNLQTEAVQGGVVLASQLAQLRVLGAWQDWLAFSAQAAAHAPWWAWEQWQLQPAGAAGQVQLEARLRLWLRPDRDGAHAWDVPDWPVTARAASTVLPLWATGVPTADESPAQGQARTPEPPQAAASGPEARWWGVWTQAGQSQLMLGRGLEWTLRAPARQGGAP